MFLLITILLCSALFLKYFSCLEANPTNRVVKRRTLFGKISGGTSIDIARYPSTVAVLANGYHVCGGTIISWRTVLSAAHCFYRPRSKIVYTVRANSTYATRGGTIYKLKKVIIHDKYEDVYLSYDFAIARTISVFDYYQILDYVRYPVPVGARVQIAGWGASELQAKTDDLQHADITVISEKLCKGWLQGYNIKRSMLCAASFINGVDTCAGDSGGPMVYGNKLAGVTSWGVACGKGYPGVYGNVSHVVGWLDQFL